MARGAEMMKPTARYGTFSSGLRRGAWAVGGLSLVGLSACARPQGPVRSAPASSQVEEHPQPSGKKAPVVQPEEAPPPPPPPDLFERGERFDFQLGTGLLGDVPQKFSRGELVSRRLRLAQQTSTANLFLAVDHHAPRRARSTSFTLADLLNEDVELAPGSHYLVAFEWGAKGAQRLQLAAFFVDVEPTTLPLSPGCLLATPELTRNGTAAKEPLRFLAVPLAGGIDRVEYSAKVGELQSLGGSPVGTEMSWKELPGGDVTLGVDCFSGSEKVGSDEQIVTLNPDALSPKGQP